MNKTFPDKDPLKLHSKFNQYAMEIPKKFPPRLFETRKKIFFAEFVENKIYGFTMLIILCTHYWDDGVFGDSITLFASLRFLLLKYFSENYLNGKLN